MEHMDKFQTTYALAVRQVAKHVLAQLSINATVVTKVHQLTIISSTTLILVIKRVQMDPTQTLHLIPACSAHPFALLATLTQLIALHVEWVLQELLYF